MCVADARSVDRRVHGTGGASLAGYVHAARGLVGAGAARRESPRGDDDHGDGDDAVHPGVSRVPARA